jgi:hypothetical protein
MGRAEILTAIYTRVADMLTANGFNYDWATLKSDGNGARVGKGVVLHASFGPEDNLNAGVNEQQQYNLEIPVTITGIGFKIDSAIRDEQYDLEIYKSKLADDIRYAFGMPYTALCSAGGYTITYNGEVDADLGDVLKRDAYEVEVTLEYLIKFRADRYTS